MVTPTTGGAPPPRPRRIPAVAMPQKVIPGHPFNPVTNPTDAAFRHIGELSLFVGGKEYGGTGTLIYTGKAYGIVTAAHNFFDKKGGQPVWTERAVFTPAYNAGGMTAPY